MFYIVPEADRRADGFVMRFNGEEETLYRLPLTANTVVQLQRLAKWLNIKGYTALIKALLVSEILQHLTLDPMAVAVERFPILGLPVPATAEECITRMREVTLVRAQRALEAGLFPAHFGLVLEQLGAQRRTLLEEERRAARAAEEARWAPPAWWEDALTEAPDVPYVKVALRIGDQVHDGYCTGVEEDDLSVVDWTEKILYLPLVEGVIEQLAEKDEWGTWEAAGYHCCCGARQITQLRGWEKVTA